MTLYLEEHASSLEDLVDKNISVLHSKLVLAENNLMNLKETYK